MLHSINKTSQLIVEEWNVYAVPQNVVPYKRSNTSHRLKQLFKRVAGSHPHTRQSLITLRSTLTTGKTIQGGSEVKTPITKGSCALIISIWTSNGKMAHSVEVVKRWKAGVLTGKPWVLLDGVFESRPWLLRYKKRNWGSALIRDMSESDLER